MIIHAIRGAFVVALIGSFYAQAESVTSISNEKQLNDIVQSKTLTIIKFEAPWCGPCKASKKPFADVAAKTKNGKVGFAAVDIDKNKALAEKFNVVSLPTVVYVVHGQEKHRSTGMNNVAGFKKEVTEKIDRLTSEAREMIGRAEEKAEVLGKYAEEKIEAKAEEFEEAMHHEQEEAGSFFHNIGGIIIGIFEKIGALLKSILDAIMGMFR